MPARALKPTGKRDPFSPAERCYFAALFDWAFSITPTTYGVILSLTRDDERDLPRLARLFGGTVTPVKQGTQWRVMRRVDLVRLLSGSKEFMVRRPYEAEAILDFLEYLTRPTADKRRLCNNLRAELRMRPLTDKGA